MEQNAESDPFSHHTAYGRSAKSSPVKGRKENRHPFSAVGDGGGRNDITLCGNKYDTKAGPGNGTVNDKGQNIVCRSG